MKDVLEGWLAKFFYDKTMEGLDPCVEIRIEEERCDRSGADNQFLEEGCQS